MMYSQAKEYKKFLEVEKRQEKNSPLEPSEEMLLLCQHLDLSSVRPISDF